jgi:hypothetical protein
MSARIGHAVYVALAASVTAASARVGDVIWTGDGHFFVMSSAGPIEVTAGGFTPANDNGTDLGDATHRFRTLFLGTSITNAGDLAIDLTGAAHRTLFVRNSTGGQTTDLDVDGALILRNGTAFAMTLSGTPTAARVITFPDATGTVLLNGTPWTVTPGGVVGITVSGGAGATDPIVLLGSGSSDIRIDTNGSTRLRLAVNGGATVWVVGAPGGTQVCGAFGAESAQLAHVAALAVTPSLVGGDTCDLALVTTEIQNIKTQLEQMRVTVQSFGFRAP